MRRLKEPSTGEKAFARTMSFLLLAFSLICAGCGGGGSGDNASSTGNTNNNNLDTTPPVVTITSPTSNATYTSTFSSLNIFGTASDNRGVISVSLSSSEGGSSITGSTDWHAYVYLIVGANTITITAKDAAGNTGSAVLTVTYAPPVFLGGLITAPSNSMVDSDVNDTGGYPTSNDTFGTAQSIRNPVVVGGYVNAGGAGAAGRSYAKGDYQDTFSVFLSKGDWISLNISDYSATTSSPQLMLLLYDGAQKLVAASINVSDSLSIDTGAIANLSSGFHYVQIALVSGASNYLLSIGQQAGEFQTFSSDGVLSSTSEFVPGEVIVRFKEQAVGSSSAQMASSLSSIGMQMKAGGPGREVLVSLDMAKGVSGRASAMSALGVPADRLSLTAVDGTTQMKVDTLLAIRALRNRPDVASADPNYIVHAARTPDDSRYSSQWNLPLIKLPDAWDVATGSSSVIVAVADTGVLLNHPDLINKLVPGYDFVKDPSGSNDGDGIDADPDDPGDKSSGSYSSFHGTHVAGIVAAETNNGAGVAGVSWGTRIMPIRVLGLGGSGSSWDIMQGVSYAAGLPNDSGAVPAQPASIINLSLGGTYYSDTEANLYVRVRNAGVIVIASSGNGGSGAHSYPASYPGVISVAAIDRYGWSASYSNYNSGVDVAAPGGDSSGGVLSLGGDDQQHILDSAKPIAYRDDVFKSGTSMAAPHVTGVAALMKGVNPTLTPDEFDQYLASGLITDDKGNTGRDNYYGYGLINAQKAVMAASGAAPTVLTASPTSLNLGSVLADATITISKLGSSALSVTNFSEDATWLTITPSPSVDGNGFGVYAVHVDRTQLWNSDFSAMVVFTDSEGRTLAVTVRMQVAPARTEGQVGALHVVLVNAETEEIVNQSSGANYYFYVPQGVYSIYAGSDRDGDGYLGDAGELFGAYGSSNQAAEIVADRDMSGLDISMTYRTIPTGAVASSQAEDNQPLIQIQSAAEQTEPSH